MRAGARDVEKAYEMATALQRGWPQKVSGRLVPVLYAYIAEPSAVQKAKELGVGSSRTEERQCRLKKRLNSQAVTAHSAAVAFKPRNGP